MVCAVAGVFESWLHPSRYRTQLCKDTAKCDRVVCFFAHSLDELRTPENSFVPPPEERLRVPEPMQVWDGLGCALAGTVVFVLAGNAAMPAAVARVGVLTC